MKHFSFSDRSLVIHLEVVLLANLVRTRGPAGEHKSWSSISVAKGAVEAASRSC